MRWNDFQGTYWLHSTGYLHNPEPRAHDKNLRVFRVINARGSVCCLHLPRPVASKEIVVACKRNSMQKNNRCGSFCNAKEKTDYCSCQSSDDHQAGFSIEAGHQVADGEEESSDQLIHHQRLHCCSNLPRSSVGRCRNRKCLGIYGFGFCHLSSHNQTFVYRLPVICLFLHWSWLWSMTIDAKSKIVFVSLTLFPRSCIWEINCHERLHI